MNISKRQQQRQRRRHFPQNIGSLIPAAVYPDFCRLVYRLYTLHNFVAPFCCIINNSLLSLLGATIKAQTRTADSRIKSKKWRYKNMTNKEYKVLREQAEQALEIYTFESYVNNGWYGFYNRYMKPGDIKDLRQEYKVIKAGGNAYSLEGFGGRALIIPEGNKLILRSYYTNVCEFDLKTEKFTKTWNGFSVTTLKHINIFRRFLALNTLSKREWIELEVV